MSPELGVLVGIFLAAAAVFFVTRPLRARESARDHDQTPLADLLAQREAAYQVLRDLDGDFQTGKLAEDDYRPMRVQALAHAAEIVAQLDAYEKVSAERQQDASANPPVAENGQAEPGRRNRVRSSQPNQFCPKCGARHGASDAFCRKCGSPLAVQPPARERSSPTYSE